MTPAPSAPWSDLLSQLIAGKDLSGQDALAAMTAIMAGDVSAVQMGAFLVALRAKGETAQEVSAAAEAMSSAAVALELPGTHLDIVGTGGDGSGTVNISTMAAVVAAACGASVIKHGNRAASSASGSADVLASLGLPLELPPAAVQSLVGELGIGFAFAPIFHPAMRHAGSVRRELGVATVFNILGPLTNPGRPTAGLIGCADERLAPVMAQVFADRGDHVLVVRGLDGWDEITPQASTRIWDTTRAPGQVHAQVLSPQDLGLSGISSADLTGADPDHNAQVMLATFGLERTRPELPLVARIDSVRAVVMANAAAALYTYESALGRGSGEGVVAGIQRQLPIAAAAIESGAAGELLRRWLHRSRALAEAIEFGQ